MVFTARLVELGWNSFFKSHFEELAQSAFTPARVVEEFKGFYRVRSADAEYLAETSGKLQHHAISRDGIPAVGDWVAIIARPEEGRAQDRAHPAAKNQARPQSCGAGDERTDCGDESRYGVCGERAESRVQSAAHRALLDHRVGQRRAARRVAQQSRSLPGCCGARS